MITIKMAFSQFQGCLSNLGNNGQFNATAVGLRLVIVGPV